MPEISVFFGIRVTMYYDDHNPPHFHADYNDRKVLVDIQKGKRSVPLKTAQVCSCVGRYSSGGVNGKLGAG